MTEQETMVERVALVMASTYHGRPVELDYLRKPATGGVVFVECARAALKAMRTPTARMLDKGVVWVGDYGNVETAWETMIDEALKS